MFVGTLYSNRGGVLHATPVTINERNVFEATLETLGQVPPSIATAASIFVGHTGATFICTRSSAPARAALWRPLYQVQKLQYQLEDTIVMPRLIDSINLSWPALGIDSTHGIIIQYIAWRELLPRSECGTINITVDNNNITQTVVNVGSATKLSVGISFVAELIENKIFLQYTSELLNAKIQLRLTIQEVF